MFYNNPYHNKKLDLKGKKIDQYYWKHNQKVLVSSIELLDGENDSGPFSIYLIEPDAEQKFHTYLFDIQNYNAFYEEIWPIKTSPLQPEKFNYPIRFDSGKAMCQPYYHARENVYTIPKFNNITKDDIVRSAKHWFRYVCDAGLIFNINWYAFPEEKE